VLCRVGYSRVNISGDHGTPTRHVSFPGVSVIDLREGRISRNLDFYDAASIMRQVGLLAFDKTDSEK